ncbi:MAG: MFS transporter [Negativicutes bacterium]|nr:MFS transporter [Negativicutes bacterium]
MNTKLYRMWIVFLLTCGTFINAVDRASLSVAAPLIIKELHLDPALMGIALSAFFWPYALLNVPAGTLADRFGSKKVLGWSVAVWSIFSAVTGLARDFYHLLFARIGVGAGEAAAFPVIAKVVAGNFPSEERGTAVGVIWAGVRLGMAVTPMMMAFLIQGWGWQNAFLITGIGSLLWCALWYFGFKDKSEPERPAGPVAKVAIPWRQLLTNRATVGLIVTKFFQDYLLYMFLTWVPAYLVMERGFSIIKMGIYASLPWMAAFVAQPIIGWLSDRLLKSGMSVTKGRKAVIIGLQVMAASVMGVGFIDDPMLAVCLLTFSIAAESGAGSLIWAIMTELAPPKLAGSLGGIMNTAGALAGILSPAITGFIVKFTGSFQLALLAGGCMLLIAALSVWLIIPELKPIEIKE